MRRLILPVLLLAGAVAASAAEPLRLRAADVPSGEVKGVAGEASLRIIDAFRKRRPDVELAPATGLIIPGRSTMDMQPLMQIAGGVAPEVLYVNFRQSDTYVRQKLLYPLDRFIEREAGLELADGHLLSTAAYCERLGKAPHFREAFGERIPRIVWDVIRRECPYGLECPHLKDWGREPAADHFHVWAIPNARLVTALFYRKDVFAEEGLPDRVPETCEELLDWARRTTNPAENTYGLRVSLSEPGYSTLTFLYSYGGRVVERDENRQWRCRFDSPEATDAYLFTARLFLEPYTNRYGRFTTCIDTCEAVQPGQRQAMWFAYLDQSAFAEIDPEQIGFGPVPKGPDGNRGSELNCRMLGIYAGTEEKDPRQLEASWDYLWFVGSHEADLIRARTYVENGLGRFVRPELLRDAGFPELAETVPEGWAEANAEAVAHGIPEPYGRNCQLVYSYVSKAIDQFRNDRFVQSAIRRGDYEAARKRIEGILHDRVAMADEKMIGAIPPAEQRFRRRVAGAVVAAVFIAFVVLLRKVGRTFRPLARKSRPLVASNAEAPLLLLLPALLTIAVWAYWPLARGSVIAFQHFYVRGGSEWVGLDNFAAVLFSAEFWHSLRVSIRYTLLYLAFGFCAPIILALLLSEVPRGKVLFRCIYYLPAVLSGVVVMFLWKGFYGPYGLVNQLCNHVLHAVNAVFGTAYADLAVNWLAHPSMALFFCLLPTIWAGMGPGCLIYLAALKTVPEDLYEAADLEGAGLFAKIRHITLPSIRALVLINFVGAMIGAMKSGSQYVLAMTGGGPYAPYGATEVVGLHIFWEAFGYLRFGSATAMAWILGSLLIGFTVFQLRRLSRMEFRGSGSAPKSMEERR